MTKPKSKFLRVLDERGFVHQCTDMEGLDARAAAGPITAYIGFDATADSLHVGSLLQIMMLRWLQQTGHKPIVLMGGGTTKIGDPSGKDETRKLLDYRSIRRNIKKLKVVFARFLRFGDGPTDAIVVDNNKWLSSRRYISFLRDYGRHFSVNRMLGFESVKLRLKREHNLSFLEFNYMVLQAYDFLELARRYDCILQMGGSDQWGNIVCGVDLARKMDKHEIFGLTSPLITTSAGAKMGKTAAGAVWLNADRFSPYDYWQYWRNTEDADVGRFLRLFTEMPLAQIRRLEKREGAEINKAKEILATKVTALLHGEQAAAAAAKSARRAFGFGKGPFGEGSFGGKPIEEDDSGASLKIFDVSMTKLKKGVPAYELLRETGLATSNSDARRLIKQGGARCNNKVITNEAHSISIKDIGVVEENFITLSAGKKRHALVRAE